MNMILSKILKLEYSKKSKYKNINYVCVILIRMLIKMYTR